jgi:hypothetical protein
MAKRLRLPAEGGNEAGMVVSERAHPPRRVGVEERASIDVEEARAFAARDDERLGVRDVAPHLRIRMPNTALIQRDDVAARRGHALL